MPSKLTIAALTLLAVLPAGCSLDRGPAGRTLRLMPAILDSGQGGDPMVPQSEWAPRLPDGPGGRADEVVGFVLFDRYLFPGEPACGLLKINRHNLPWRQRVHFEVWDASGLNLLWQTTCTVWPGETYLVQIAPLADAGYVDQTLQLRVRANVFAVSERVTILPPPPTAPAPAGPAAGDASPDALLGAVLPVPLPAGPLSPSDEPLVLLAGPGETVAGAAVLWPTHPGPPVASELVGEGPAPAARLQADIQRVDLRERSVSPVGPAGAELSAGLSNVFLLKLTAPAAPGSYAARWVFRQGEAVLFSRPVHLTVFDLPLPPASDKHPTGQARYLAALDGMIRSARARGDFRTRLLADAIEKRVDAAAEHYAARPVAGPLAPILGEDVRFAFKLRWLIVRSIQQLRAAGVAAADAL